MTEQEKQEIKNALKVGILSTEILENIREIESILPKDENVIYSFDVLVKSLHDFLFVMKELYKKKREH